MNVDLTAVFFNELGAWTDLARVLLLIGIILVIAWIMLGLLIPMLRKQLQHTDGPERHKRPETRGRVFRSATVVVISLITVMLALSEMASSPPSPTAAAAMTCWSISALPTVKT